MSNVVKMQKTKKPADVVLVTTNPIMARGFEIWEKLRKDGREFDGAVALHVAQANALDADVDTGAIAKALGATRESVELALDRIEADGLGSNPQDH